MRLRRGLDPAADPQPDLVMLADEHARARGLAARQLSEPLGPIDTAWLTAHLSACPNCSAVAAAYAADRSRLVELLRDRPPQPPRDLWARTSIALERERERSFRLRRASLPPRAPQPPLRGWPVTSRPRPHLDRRLLSGLLVMVLVGGTALATWLEPGLGLLSVQRSARPAATPIAISADVGWIQPSADGSYDVYLARVAQVCPPGDASGCGPISEPARTSITLGARPQSVAYSPLASQLVVVGSSARGGGAVYVVAVPPPAPLGTAAPGSPASASPTTTPVPTARPVPTAFASASPAASAAASVSPSVLPSATPSATTAASPLGSPAPTAAPTISASPAVSPAIAPTPAPSLAASPSPANGSSPPASPSMAASTPASPIVIAEGVIVVGGSTAYSPDGRWLAFAARPADGSAGPDIYLWRVGDPAARMVTSDHRSIFASWLGDRILASRVDRDPASAIEPRPTPSNPAPIDGIPSASPSSPGAASPGAASPGAAFPAATAGGSPGEPSPKTGTIAPDGDEHRVTTFVLDPATGESWDLPGARLWRPVVDPAGRWVAYWDGTVRAPDGVDWRPATGQIVVAPWVYGSPAAAAVPLASSDASARPSPSAPPASASILPSHAPGTPGAARQSAGPSSSPSEASSSSTLVSAPSPGASAEADSKDGQALVSAPVVDFDVEFDPAGVHLGIWTASPSDPATGYLSLFVFRDDRWTVTASQPPVEAPALRGFSIGSGELAWVSPPDASGQGSHVEVVGWTADGFGVVESLPGDRLIVIR